MFRKLIIASALAFAAAGSAIAADMPTKAPVMVSPAYNWTGLYVGVDAGYSWARVDDNLIGINTSHPKPNGFVGGAHASYLWQVPSRWVFGIEADIWGADVDGFALIPATVNNSRSEINWGGSIRGAIGYAFNQFLLYGTGGVAMADVDVCITPGGSTSCAPGFRYSQTRVGWIAGVGLAYALSQHWSVRGEYLFADYGDKNGTATLAHRVDLETHTARLGLSYRF